MESKEETEENIHGTEEGEAGRITIASTYRVWLPSFGVGGHSPVWA